MYFKNIPTISYRFNISGKEQNIFVKDITANVRFIKKTMQSISLFDNYIIKDGDTPEKISDKFYGNPEYHWIIMLSNDKLDYINDFPRTSAELEQYLIDKYGDQLYEPAFYIKDGFIVDSTLPGRIELSNYDYEVMLNDEKRNIKIIPKQYINSIVEEYRRIMNG